MEMGSKALAEDDTMPEEELLGPGKEDASSNDQ